jgi:hypothetical protein
MKEKTPTKVSKPKKKKAHSQTTEELAKRLFHPAVRRKVKSEVSENKEK